MELLTLIFLVMFAVCGVGMILSGPERIVLYRFDRILDWTVAMALLAVAMDAPDWLVWSLNFGIAALLFRILFYRFQRK